jgi:hypothetical protein
MKEEGLDQVFVLNEDIAHREIEGQILFLRPDDHFLYTVNASGQFIWHEILNKTPLSGIIRNLSVRFGISEEKAEKDVLKFIRELQRKKIIFKKEG